MDASYEDGCYLRMHAKHRGTCIDLLTVLCAGSAKGVSHHGKRQKWNLTRLQHLRHLGSSDRQGWSPSRHPTFSVWHHAARRGTGVIRCGRSLALNVETRGARRRCIAQRDLAHDGRRRALVQGSDHVVDILGRAFEMRGHGTVGLVADPAAEPAALRLDLRPGPEIHTLYPARYPGLQRLDL